MNKERTSTKKEINGITPLPLDEKISLLLTKNKPAIEKYSYLEAIAKPGCQINFRHYR